MIMAKGSFSIANLTANIAREMAKQAVWTSIGQTDNLIRFPSVFLFHQDISDQSSPSETAY